MFPSGGFSKTCHRPDSASHESGNKVNDVVGLILVIGDTTHEREIVRPRATLGETANVLILFRRLQIVDPKVKRGDRMVGRREG